MSLISSSITLENIKIFSSSQTFQHVLCLKSSTITAGQFYLRHKEKDPAFVELTAETLIIKKGQNQTQIIQLDFSLKFQIILQVQQNIKSKKIGFKLIRQNSDEVLTLFASSSISIAEWVHNLSCKINQFGFHKNFKPIRRLGKGQFATVFQVQNLQTGSKHAVKAFSKSHLAKTPKGIESLINQIKIMRSFKHENLQKLQSVYQSDNSIYLVTEILRGGSLFDRVQKMGQQNKKINMQQIKTFMQGLFLGLEELGRKKIVHRDLKLDNIMLRNANTFQPVIIDFGLATFEDEPEYIYYRCGTPGYVSPEVMASSKLKKTESISDIFSAGAVFHHLLTQKPLFEGSSPEQVLGKNKNYIYDLSTPFYEDVEFQAICLLSRMLQVNSNKRITANQAISHDFFCQSLVAVSSPKTTGDDNQKYQKSFQ